MKFDYTKKILLMAILVFLAVVTAVVIFSDLLLDKVVDINDKVRQLEISSQERLKELSLKDSVVSSEEERKKLAEYFVGSGNAETVDFTKYLEDLAKSFNITQKKTLNYEPVNELKSSDVVSAIHYTFQIYGRWSDIFNFIQAIENLPKVSFLNGVALNLSPEGVTNKEMTKTVEKNWSAILDFSVIKLKN
jgi:hypothetical protein